MALKTASAAGAAGVWATRLALVALAVGAVWTRVQALHVDDELNADEALPGLMALHIAAGRETPVFYYGQHYFGAVEAYLVAALDRFAGFHDWFIYVPPIVASTLLVLVTYALGAAVGGRLGGLFAALPIAVPPPMLARLYAGAGGGFSVAFLLHGVLLVSVLRGLRSPDHQLAWAALGSLVAGVLIWIWQPAAALYLALVALLICWTPVLRWPVTLAAALAPVLPGLLPPLLDNAHRGWPTVFELAHKYAAPANEASAGPRGDLLAVLSYFWLALGGGNEAEGGANPILAGAIVAGALLAGAILLSRSGPKAEGRRAKERSRRSPAEATSGIGVREAGLDWRERRRAAIALAVAILVDVAAAHATSRHLVPAALAATALAGGGLGLLAARGRAGAVAACAVALCAAPLPDALLWRSADQAFQHFVPRAGEAQLAVQALDARGLVAGYSDYWSAYPITFFAAERIVVAPAVPAAFGGRFDRYPAYTRTVDATEDPRHLFLLLDDRCSPLPYVVVLEQQDAAYQLEHLARWYLLWDLRPQPDAAGETLAAWRQVIYDRQYC